MMVSILQQMNATLGKLSWEAWQAARQEDPNAPAPNPIQITNDQMQRERLTLLANIGDALLLYVTLHITLRDQMFIFVLCSMPQLMELCVIDVPLSRFYYFTRNLLVLCINFQEMHRFLAFMLVTEFGDEASLLERISITSPPGRFIIGLLCATGASEIRNQTDEEVLRDVITRARQLLSAGAREVLGAGGSEQQGSSGRR